MIPILKISSAHGINGAVRVLLHEKIEKHEEVFDIEKNLFKIKNIKHDKGDFYIIMFHGINDRNSAEKLKNTVLYQEKKSLLDGEYYVSDLIGHIVTIPSSTQFCEITDVVNYGAGDILELRHSDKTFLIPFVKDFVSQDYSGDFIITKDVFEAFFNI